VWALQTSGKKIVSASLGAPPGAKRTGRTWDDRHHQTWNNDSQHPNGRNYFDRYRDKGDAKDRAVPACRVRPVWTLECPNVEANEHTYRVFDATTASHKDVIWMVDKNGKTLGGEEGQPPRTRTPRTGKDLKHQRGRESDFDKFHGIVYSRNNGHLQVNYRSYFDRWKDGDGPDTRETTWKLGIDKRVFLKSTSAPSLMDRKTMLLESKWRHCNEGPRASDK